jgi:MoaA/NifB/PqqE/SkfB family radical SAM enzyme
MHYVLKSQSEYALSESVLKNYGCTKLSNYFEIHTNGNISLCCYTWLPVFCGNILENSPEEILNNTKRLKLIDDMSKGEYTECNDHCPYISATLNGSRYPSEWVVPINSFNQEKNIKPYVIGLSYDTSCNLQCPSCRNSLQFFQLDENKKLSEIHEKTKQFIDFLLAKGISLIIVISGSSDPFAGPTFWNYLKELSLNPESDIRLQLITNGTLMTQTKLLEIKPLLPKITQITLSIDAADETTYKIVRKNGSFRKLEENVKNLNDLISNGFLPNLRVLVSTFVVQKRNFREMKEFILWQLCYNNIHKIYFSAVAQWGHINDIDFQLNFCLNEEEKIELKEILKDPIFSHPKVMLGNVLSLIK